MQPVELAGGEEVLHLKSVLAAIDVEDKLLSCEDVVFVEGAASPFLVVDWWFEHFEYGGYCGMMKWLYIIIDLISN